MTQTERKELKKAILASEEVEHACHAAGLDIYDIDGRFAGSRREFRVGRNQWCGQDDAMDRLADRGLAKVIYSSESGYRAYRMTARGLGWLQRMLPGLDVLVPASLLAQEGMQDA